MVAILEKSDAAGGFGQIIDFLSGSYIQHALIVNPHVYISCVKQFWNTAVVKRSGDVTSTYGYEKPSDKLTFYKAYFSSQWKFFIHTLLHTLSSKRTSWNEFSSAMASAWICLSTGQWFNFSKYIFESLVRNVNSTSKFYMYPRVGKGFLEVETPLFENMLEVIAVDAEEEVQTANTAQQLEILKLKASVKKLERLNKVKSSKLRRLKKVGTSQRVESSEDVENVFNQGRISVDMETAEGIELEEDTKVQEAVDGLANMRRVGKGCSGVETPLFENMLQVREEDAEEEVQVSAHDHVDQENVIEEIADDVAQPTSPLPPYPFIPPTPPHQSPRTSPSQATEDDQEKDDQVKGRQVDTQAKIYNIDLNHTSK
nr:hypothetical protein [Tanacetum cinerariifolium]